MKSCIDHVIYKAMRPSVDGLNFIYLPYNGLFEWMLSSVKQVGLHIPKESLVYDWPCDHWPSNTTWLPGGIEVIPNRIDIDAVIVNWRKDHAFLAERMADAFHIPLVIIDHELPADTANKNLKKYVNSRMPKKAIFVSITNTIKDEWEYNDDMEIVNIPYGFDIPAAIEKPNDVLVVGDYHNEDGPMLNEMLNAHSEVVCLGYNGHGTKYKSLHDIITAMSQSKICITASQTNQPPFLAMHAASAGCAVVTNRTKWTESVFKHNHSVKFFDSMTDIKKHVRDLLRDSNSLDNMAAEARRTIVEHYSMEKFQTNWNNLMQDITKRVYIR